MRCLPKDQNCPQRRLNSWHTPLEREGSRPFTSVRPIWIVAVSLFSVAGTGVAKGCVGAPCFTYWFQRSSRFPASMHFQTRPTNKLLHTRARQSKQRITGTGQERKLHIGTRRPKERITSTSHRLRRSTPSARSDRGSCCRPTRPIRHRQHSCRRILPR